MRQLWALVARQHGVIAREQLLACGLSKAAIDQRVANGRLHQIWTGVYAVGRPDVTQLGRWMAAVLACGPRAALSHDSAAALYGLRQARPGPIHVSVPVDVARGRDGITVHRRAMLAGHVRRWQRIPVTEPALLLVDLAAQRSPVQIERLVNEADRLDLIDPERLREEIDSLRRIPGVRALRETLDRPTFTLTDSELERRFVPIARRAGLAEPVTQAHVNGFRVDFYWPDLGLVVETDGLRYHRTPAKQAEDHVRDQIHTANGFTRLRFTHDQVARRPNHVEAVLSATRRRLARERRER